MLTAHCKLSFNASQILERVWVGYYLYYHDLPISDTLTINPFILVHERLSRVVQKRVKMSEEQLSIRELTFLRLCPETISMQ